MSFNPSDPRTWPVAPAPAATERAWKQIADIATAHCLILQAYGGTMTLATPEVQREHGLREQVLRTHQTRDTAALHGRACP